jgi:hypothetical protein
MMMPGALEAKGCLRMNSASGVRLPVVSASKTYLQFAFRKLTLAVCSRIRRDGIVEIEVGQGDPRLPKSAFTADQMPQAAVASRTRLGSTRHGRPVRTV